MHPQSHEGRVVAANEFQGGPKPQPAGFGISYRVVKFRVDGMGKPKDEVTFDDLWTKTPEGVMVPREPERVVADSVATNKFLKRGISWLCNLMLRNKSTVTETERNLPDIDVTTRSKNPLSALVLVSDDSPLVHPGDAIVEWGESDAAANAKIPSSVSGAFTPAGYGIRAILLDEATDPMKVVQSRYPDTVYYSQLEYTIFAKANVSAVQTGNQGIDNFPIKSIGIANGILAGHDDADSQWASRAILGLYPTLQAWKWPERVGVPASNDPGTDRPYRHEHYVYDDAGSGSVAALHKYSGVEVIAGNGDGYVTSNEAADGSLTGDVNISITPNAADQFFAATKQIKLGGATFTVEHALRRNTLKIASTSNTGDFTVKRRVSADTVEVFETVVNEGPGVVTSADLVSRHTGDKAFDGRVENEGKVYQAADDGDANAIVVMGENWRSADAPSGHFVARVWNASKLIRGVRIICGQGTPLDSCPDKFKIQYLNPAANGGSPRPPQEADWLDVAGQDYTGSGGQAVIMYPLGEYGYEYHFAAPVTTQGIKLASAQNISAGGYVEIQQLLVYEESDDHVIASPNNVLRVSIDGGGSYKQFTVPVLAATKNLQYVVDALNEILIGDQLEAVRTEFGILIIRGTVEGDNSRIQLDTNGNGSTINASLGLDPAGLANKTGESQSITKVYDEALTLIVTASYLVDLAWAE